MSENTFSSLYLAFVSTVHTIKPLPNLEQLDIIGTESLEEIWRWNSRGHVTGAGAELWRQRQGRMQLDKEYLIRKGLIEYTSRVVEKFEGGLFTYV